MNVAIVGLGVGLEHVRGWEAAGCRVSWFCDTDLKKWPHRHGTGFCTDWRALLDHDIQAVSICTPDSLHAEMAATFLEAGVHVFCEKPLCLTREELENIRNCSCSARLSVNLPLRTWRPTLDLKENLSKIGSMYLARAEYRWGRAEKLSGWRGNTPNYSAMLGGGVHMVDLLRFLTGEEPKNPLRNEISAGMKLFQTANFVLGNAIGQVTADFLWKGEHSYGIEFFGTDGQAKLIADCPVDKAKPVEEFGRALVAQKDLPVPEIEVFRTMEACLLLNGG